MKTIKTNRFLGLMLAALLVACGGGGGGGDDSGSRGGKSGPYTISGNVSNLNGNGLTLQNNGGDDLAVSGSGTFAFTNAIAAGSDYSVTVLTQPTNPVQFCTVSGGTGTANADVTSVAVNCAAPSAGDTDNDGLTDQQEAQFGTNPIVADTDGDGFLDKEEVDNWDRFSGNHLRFNPLVADVPRIYMRQLGTPVIQLLATTQSQEPSPVA